MVLLEQYLKEPIYFLRTITLKNKYFADQLLSNDVKEHYQMLLDQKDTPYYKHLSGDYILEDGFTEVNGSLVSNKMIYNKFDTLMTIVSLDTQKEIAFTKANLLLHPKTAAWYRMPNSYYFKLCDRYPTQTDLIKSIVYPVTDIDAAIKADNFSMLNYDRSMLQDNEYVSIINALNNTLTLIRTRWDVKEYTFEDMYAVVQQSLIWYILYYTIIVQRVQNIKTASVHEWHIWEYLKSRGLGDYRDVLSFKQSLFLYKNIDYLLKNKGTDRNFSILIGALLSELNVSLYTKSLIQSTTTVVETSDNVKTLSHQMLNGIIAAATPAAQVMGTSETSEKAGGKQMLVNASDEFSSTPELNPIFGNTTKPAVKVLSTTTGDEYLIKQAFEFVKSTSKEAAASSNNLTTSILNISRDQTSKNNLTELLSGTIEQLDYTFEKEQESLLEYTDENLFKLSTEKQKEQFPVTPHTLLVTKAHEINKNVKSALFEQIYAKFMTDSYLYRTALGDLNKLNVTVQLSDSVTATLSAKEAIALAMYFAAKEYNITLEYPPNAVDLYWGYKEQFPELPKTFKFHNKTKLVKSYLSDYGFTDMHAYPSDPGFSSVDDLAKSMDDQAMNFIDNYIEVHSNASSIHFEILAKVYNDRTIHGRYYINLLGGENTSYKDWLEEHESIKYLIESYENATDKVALYAESYLNLIKELFPVENKYLMADSVNDSYVFKRIKQLFVSLCSYNITFFDKAIDATNPTVTFWLHTQELLKQSNTTFIRWWFQVQEEYWRSVITYYVQLGEAFSFDIKGPNCVKYGFAFDTENFIKSTIQSKHWVGVGFKNATLKYTRTNPSYITVDNLVVLNDLINHTNHDGSSCVPCLGASAISEGTLVYVKDIDTWYQYSGQESTEEGTEALWTLVESPPVTPITKSPIIVKCSMPGCDMQVSGTVTAVYRNNTLHHVEVDKTEETNVPDYKIENGEFIHISHVRN